MGWVHPESQSVNRIYVSKAVGNSWFLVLVNDGEGLIRFRYWYIPHRSIYQANLEGVHVNIRPRCVSV